MSELLSREVENNDTKRFYDYDSQGDRVGQQVTTGATNRYRAYVKDANGSVLGLEDGDGVVDDGTDPDGKSAKYEYDPYGDLENPDTLNEEAEDNPFRFEGFYFDSGVKSYDMQARAYRPDVGRFLTQDRYASASQDLLLQSDALTQNRYAFGGGNPVNNIEFDGHDSHAINTHEQGGCFSKCGGSSRADRATQVQGEAGSGGQSERPANWPNTETSNALMQRAAKAAQSSSSDELPRGGLRFKAAWDRQVRKIAVDTAKSTADAVASTPDIFYRHIKYHCQVSLKPKPGCPTMREYAKVLEAGSTFTGAGGLLRAGAMKAGAPLLAEVSTTTGKVAPKVAPLVAPAVHGNAASSTVPAYLYRLYSASGNYLKTGISQNPFARYTRTYMQDKEMEILTSGSRREMLNLERFIVERDPGPLNRERWAGRHADDVPGGR
jgi:RHS repeat-associated protein